MTSYRFTILGDIHCDLTTVPYQERLSDHEAVLQAYFRTFEKRAYVQESLKRTEGFLRSVFEGVLVQDAEHPKGQRHLLIWDLVCPKEGSAASDLLATSLNKYGYAQSTRLRYLGEIRRLCDFVIIKPYIPGRVSVSIVEKYGRLAQPFSQYDSPTHSVDDDNVDPAITGQDLIRFLNFIRLEYISQNQKKHTAQRNYTMIVLAVTGGMRANELINLDLDDLRYGEDRVWIRFGKGYKGSGKRQRLTLFTPLAQATLRVYEAHTRPSFGKAQATNRALFLSETGERITYDAMRLAFDAIVEAARKAGIELPNPFGLHDLRRSFATEYLEKWPEQIIILTKYMGHTGLGTLHRYIRPSRKAFQKATDKVLARFLPQVDNFNKGE